MHNKLLLVDAELASTDEPLVYAAYERYRVDMLRGGVELYEFSATLGRGLVREIVKGDPVLRMHTKCLVFDEESVFIGSLNFDPRSRDHNTEVGILIRSPELAQDTLALLKILQTEAAYRVALRWQSAMAIGRCPGCAATRRVPRSCCSPEAGPDRRP